MLSPVLTTATYVLRLKMPNGDTEQISGCDSEDLDHSIQMCHALSRWLHGDVLYAGSFPDRALGDVFRLRGYLMRRGIDRLSVQTEVVAMSVRGDVVVFPTASEDDLEDTTVEPVLVKYSASDDDPLNPND